MFQSSISHVIKAVRRLTPSSSFVPRAFSLPSQGRCVASYDGPLILKRGEKNTVDCTVKEKPEQGPLVLETSIRAKHAMMLDDRGLHGGSDVGPGPYDLLVTALAGCKSMTLRIWAQSKNKTLPPLQFDVLHSKKNSNDVPEAGEKGIVDLFEVTISLRAPAKESDRALLTEEFKKELMDISHRCPVHRTLTGNPRTVVRSRWA